MIANTAWRNPADFEGGPWHCDAGPHIPRAEGVAWDDRIPYPVFAIGAHIYLQDCTRADGPTAIVPGSHRSGRLAPLRPACSTTTLTYDGRPPVVVEANAGDVALFVSDVWHRGLPATDDGRGRYFLQVHYGRRDIAQRMRTTDQVNQLSPEAIERAKTERAAHPGRPARPVLLRRLIPPPWPPTTKNASRCSSTTRTSRSARAKRSAAQPVRLPPDRRRARRAGPGRRAPRVRRLVALRRRPPRAHAPPRRAHRDPAADGRGAQERGRHQDGGRRDRAVVRARLHHHVRARHRRQRLHAARPQAPRAEPAGDRHRDRGVDVGAAAARVRRVPVLRAARGRRARRAEAREPDAGAPDADAGRARRRGRGRREAADEPARPARSRPRRARHPDALRARAQHRWAGARVDAEAHDPAQGPDVQRDRPTASAASASCCATSPSAVSSSSARARHRRPEVVVPDAGRRAGRRVRAAALGRRASSPAKSGRRTCRA